MENIMTDNCYSEYICGDVSVCKLVIENELQSTKYACEIGDYTTIYFSRCGTVYPASLQQIISKELSINYHHKVDTSKSINGKLPTPRRLSPVLCPLVPKSYF